MKKIFLLLFGATLFSCSDFLDTAPRDQLSSATFWKTENDAYKGLVGCYSDWINPQKVVGYMDCMSDFAYNQHVWDGYQIQANGSMDTDVNPGEMARFYDYQTIRRCNNFLANVDAIPFKDDNADGTAGPTKKNYKAQVRAIRAYRYSWMNMWYGGVPLANDLYETSKESQLPKSTEAEVYKFVQDELAAAVPDLDKDVSKAGLIDKGTALAIKMRSALWMNDFPTALAAANEIKALGKYELETEYAKLFNTKPVTSKELIYRRDYLVDVSSFWSIAFFNRSDGGWASVAPTRNVVEMYEMASGLTKDEPGSGYDATQPFAGRDPRMAATLLYPGKDLDSPKSYKQIFNSLDLKTKNADGEEIQNPDCQILGNAAPTAMLWAKYTSPIPPDLYNTNVSPIVYRYAEVLLTIAECQIEAGNFGAACDEIDAVRTRAGMPVVDRAKYSTKEKMTELLRRERAVEFAGEGLRRADILRWKDGSGKMLAETVLNGVLWGYTGTVNLDEPDPTKRATLTGEEANFDPKVRRRIEDRVFKPYMRYFPFMRSELTNNPNLVQNDGYAK